MKSCACCSPNHFLRCQPVGLTDDRTEVISDTVSVIVEERKVARWAGTSNRLFPDISLLAVTLLWQIWLRVRYWGYRSSRKNR